MPFRTRGTFGTFPFSRKALRVASALTVAIGTGVTASIALPARADAATPSATLVDGEGGRTFDYTAAAGQTNKVTVTATSVDGSTFTYVIDDVVPIDIDPNNERCTHPDNADRTKASCTNTPMYPGSGLRIKLGDGNDTLTYNNATGRSEYQASIDLGPGKDRSIDTGSAGGNYVDAGPGDDTVTLGPDGILDAEEGNDTIYLADRAVASGQSGVDKIYANGVDSKADGGTGNDLIYGGAGRQTLDGGTGTGNDTIRGGTGNDLLYGNPGADVLYGNSGNDTIYGNSGNDKLYGGPGRDTLSGGPGTDVVRQD